MIDASVGQYAGAWAFIGAEFKVKISKLKYVWTLTSV